MLAHLKRENVREGERKKKEEKRKRREIERKRERKERNREIKREKERKERKREKRMSRVNYYQSAFNSQKEKNNLLAEMLEISKSGFLRIYI